MKMLLLPDELKAFTEKAVLLWEQYKDAWKRAGEACSQSSETWHDNFEFEDANRTMQTISKLLSEVQRILTNAQVIPSIANNAIVNVGKRVRICIDGEDQEYVIWGYHTPIEGRVGYTAPLIQPLLWKTEWDVVEVSLHGKKREIEILEVKVGVWIIQQGIQ